MPKPLVLDATTSAWRELASGDLLLPSDPTVALAAATKQYVDASCGVMQGYKNKIINGRLDFWQRGTSFGNNVYTADRWATGNTGSSTAVTRQSMPLGQTGVPPGCRRFLRAVVTSVAGAGNIAYITQKIEDVRTLAGQVATVSFYAKADTTRPMAFELEQQFGTGGSPSSPVNGVATGKVTLTTSWQRFSATFTLPSISGKTTGSNSNDNLNLIFFFDAGSNFNARTQSLGQQSGTFDIVCVSVEPGPNATDFDNRPLAEELFLCQRYFETSFAFDVTPAAGLTSFHRQGTAWGLTAARIFIPFMVTKRSQPTITLIAPLEAGTGNQVAIFVSGTWIAVTPNAISAGLATGLGFCIDVPTTTTVGFTYLISTNMTAESEL